MSVMPFTATDQQVETFLAAAGRHVALSAETLETYRPIVSAAGHPGTLRWQGPRHLVAQGQLPDTAAINAEEARRAQRIADAIAEAEAKADAARAYVAAVRADTGTGPTWSELCQHLGWSGQRGKTGVRHLINKGHLIATGDERSLAVSPR